MLSYVWLLQIRGGTLSGLLARHPYYPHTSGISVMTILIPPSRGRLRTLVGRSEETSTRVSTGVRTSARACVGKSADFMSPPLPAHVCTATHMPVELGSTSEVFVRTRVAGL